MARTKNLTLTTVLQQVIAQSVCLAVLISEDELGTPLGLKLQKAFDQTDDVINIAAGKPYQFSCGKWYQKGDFVGWVGVQSGSNAGYQDET
jgi:hypothetical protein